MEILLYLIEHMKVSQSPRKRSDTQKNTIDPNGFKSSHTK